MRETDFLCLDCLWRRGGGRGGPRPLLLPHSPVAPHDDGHLPSQVTEGAGLLCLALREYDDRCSP